MIIPSDTAREIEPSADVAAPSRRPAGESVMPSKPAPVEFPLETSVGAAFATVARSCLDHLLANETAALAGEDPEGIHQVRVAVRRLRSALRFFRKSLDPAERKQVRGELRWLAGELGPARDWDVLVTQTLKRRQLRAAARKARIARLAEPFRAAARETARAALRSPRYATLIVALEQMLDGGNWHGTGKRAAFAARPMADAAPVLIDRSHEEARAAGKHVTRLDPEERHALRKQLKELRYAAAFLRPLYPGKPAQRYVAALGRLQDVLGELNDYETARLLLPSGDKRTAALLAAAEIASAEALQGLPEAWRAFKRTGRFWVI